MTLINFLWKYEMSIIQKNFIISKCSRKIMFTQDMDS